MRLSQFGLLPLHAAQIFTGAKSFEKNPVLGSRRLNQRGLHLKRVALAMSLAERRRRVLGRDVDQQYQDAYQRDGYVRIDNFLSKDVFAEVSREIDTAAFERFDMVQGGTVTRRAMLDISDVSTLPGFRSACSDPRLAGLIRYVASCAGRPLLTLQVVMAAASQLDGRQDPQTVLHSDTFQPTAKAWLFLRDVPADEGPFAYVPGSHKMTPERCAWEQEISENVHSLDNRYSARGSLRVAEMDLPSLGYGEPVQFAVPANTLIVADTHGFHARCASPKPTTRIEIYGSLRRNPFLPFALPALGGLHFAALPGLRSRTNRSVIRGLAMMEKARLRGNPWRPQGWGKAHEWPGELLSEISEGQAVR